MDNLEFNSWGNSPKMQRVISQTKNVSVTKTPVLISGEIGVGKRTLGKFIHKNSARFNQVIKIVDCSQDAELVSNQILGYREAGTQRFIKGALEEADKGTLILLNIESLDSEFQSRLYKVFTELDDYDLDIRIIATTVKNISKLVAMNKFHRGFYTYISTSIIHIPPLRDRIEDLEMLSKYFANNLSKDGFPIKISDSAMDKILSHYWTYNIKELKAVIEASKDNLVDGIIREVVIDMIDEKAVKILKEDNNEGIRLMSLREAEELLIKKALIHTSENRTQAAKILGVSIRTLRNKINEYRSMGNTYFINLR